MDAVVGQRFDAIEKRRKELVDRVRALPAAKQTAKPTSKEFSPVEVIQHFALTEQMSLDRMKKAGPVELKGKKAKTNFIYRRVVGGMDSLKRIPAGPGTSPKTTATLDEADKQWAQVRQELKGYLEQASSIDAPVQPFALFGTMSAGDLLALLESHHKYHESFFPG